MNKTLLIFLFFWGAGGLLSAQQQDTTFYDEDKTMIKEIFYSKNGLPEGEYKWFNEEIGRAHV